MLMVYVVILVIGFLALIVVQLATRVKRPSYGKSQGDPTPHLHDALKEKQEEKKHQNSHDSFREKPDTMLRKFKSMAKEKQGFDDNASFREDPRTLTRKMGGVTPLAEQAEGIPTHESGAVDVAKLEQMLSEKNKLIEDLQRQLQQEHIHRNSFDQVQEVLKTELAQLRLQNKTLKHDVDQLREAAALANNQDKTQEDVVSEKQGEDKDNHDVVAADDMTGFDQEAAGEGASEPADEDHPGEVRLDEPTDILEREKSELEESVKAEFEFKLETEIKDDSLSAETSEMTNTDDDIIPGPAENKKEDEDVYPLPDEDSPPKLHDIFSPLMDEDDGGNDKKSDLKKTTKNLEDSLLSDIEDDLNQNNDQKDA